MKYGGTITDSKGATVPGAYVQFRTDTGQVVANMPMINGLWQIDSDFDSDLLEPGIVAFFMAPGYLPYSISSSSIDPVFNVTLRKMADIAMPLFIGGAVALLALTNAGRGIMGKAEGEIKKGFALPPWAMQVLPFAVIGGFALWYLNKSDPKAKDSATLLPATDDKLNTLAASGQLPTLDNATFQALASQVVEATDDCGTDEDSLYHVFATLRNEADFWKLVQVFGVRQIKSCFGGDYFSNTPYNLIQIISEELGRGELNNVNAILQNAGITYRF